MSAIHADSRLVCRNDNAVNITSPISPRINHLQGFSQAGGRRSPVGLRGAPGRRHDLIDRFWARVKKEEGGCWIFAGAKGNRIGHIHIAREDGRRVPAHRLSFEIHRGPIPDGLLVCHHCDVPACVNPDHLFLGTNLDNQLDSIRKGRRRAWGRQKLSAREVRAIRQAWMAGGVTQRALGQQYGIARNTVSGIVNRKSWAHLQDSVA